MPFLPTPPHRASDQKVTFQICQNIPTWSFSLESRFPSAPTPTPSVSPGSQCRRRIPSAQCQCSKPRRVTFRRAGAYLSPRIDVWSESTKKSLCSRRSRKSCNFVKTSLGYHARVLEGVAKSQYPLKAQVFKSQPPFIRTVSKPATPSNSLAWGPC